MSVLEKRPSKANSSLQLVGAVDQGTSSTRFLIFNAKTAELVTFHQMEVPQLFPNEGWVEEDAQEILKTVHRCIEVACHNLTKMNISTQCVKAIGITNQRETTVMWDKSSGYPLHNAIVWCDNRTTTTVDELIAKTPDKSQDYLKKQCGLPISTYFSAVKVRWLLDNRPSVKKAVDNKYALFGTIDSWLLWNLTGGTAGGQHVTDITNASRTMLFNINHEQWDPKLLEFFDIPHHILPDVRSNSEVYGHMTSGPLKGVPLSGCLGDQQAALVGHMCFKPGDAKNTYGTGCFLLQNTGTKAVMSQHGMLTTVAYQLGKDAPVHFALEGSIAVAGGLVRWLRDNLEIIKDSAEIELLARTVENSGDVVFVPAFSGLYAPYWRSDARGTVCGITQWTTKAHIAYAALEAVCFQTREIIEAMEKDACDNPQDSTGGSNAQDSTRGSSLQVDGGMTNNQLLLQIQADILGKTVLKPSMPETTALGAAMAAGHAIGVWSLDPRDLTSVTFERFQPAANHDEIEARYRKWKRAVQKSMGWTFPASHDASD